MLRCTAVQLTTGSGADVADVAGERELGAVYERWPQFSGPGADNLDPDERHASDNERRRRRNQRCLYVAHRLHAGSALGFSRLQLVRCHL